MRQSRPQPIGISNPVGYICSFQWVCTGVSIQGFQLSRYLAQAIGSAVDWHYVLNRNVVLQFLERSQDFSIYSILQTALWFWSRLSVKQKLIPGIFPEVKSSRLVRRRSLTNLRASTACHRDSIASTFYRSVNFTTSV
jgi:hypothetical protein